MNRIIRICELNPECNPKYDLTRRVYSRGGGMPHHPGAGRIRSEDPDHVGGEKMTVERMPQCLAIIGCRSAYSRRNWVFSTLGVAPTVMANWGFKSPPLDNGR